MTYKIGTSRYMGSNGEALLSQYNLPVWHQCLDPVGHQALERHLLDVQAAVWQQLGEETMLTQSANTNEMCTVSHLFDN